MLAGSRRIRQAPVTWQYQVNGLASRPMSAVPDRPRSGLLRDTDALLRGDLAPTDGLALGILAVPLARVVRIALVAGVVAGTAVGAFGVLRGTGHALQILSSAIKVPLLFALTLAVTAPSLCAFSALARSSLGAAATLRLLAIACATALAITASFAPILLFFALCTESYAFLVLLDAAAFAVGGGVGLGVLLRMLKAVFPVAPRPPVETNDPATAPGALRPRARPEEHLTTRRLFRVWVVVFALVGAQMAWVLRPFLGAPGLPFEWFRDRESNVFAALLHALGVLLRG